MSDFWVLVADEGSARLFFSDKIRVELKEMETLTNPDARLHERALVAGNKGRSYDSHNNQRHAIEPQTSAREQSAMSFAKRLARKLEQGAESHSYDRLILIAAPHTLGLLRQQLGQNARQCLHQTINKDLVRLKPEDILRHLAA